MVCSHQAARVTSVFERLARIPWALYGFCLFSLGLLMYFFGVLLVFPRYLLGLNWLLYPVSEWIVWYSGLPLLLGALIVIADLLLLLPWRRTDEQVRWGEPEDRAGTIALTAYNDEALQTGVTGGGQFVGIPDCVTDPPAPKGNHGEYVSGAVKAGFKGTALAKSAKDVTLVGPYTGPNA